MRITRSAGWLVMLVAMTWGEALAQESPFIYGIHDHDTNIQEYLDHFNGAGVTGWVTATVAIGSDPSNTGGDDFRWISEQGHSVIVRLNNGYCGSGTIPTPDKYDDFARRAANYVAATQGADQFIIGNETNLPGEWPPVNGHASFVSPQDYAVAFRKAYDAIKAVRPDAKVLSQALAPFAGPYSAGSACSFTHDANPLNWVQYMNQMLTAIKNSGGIDGIALHINSRGYTQADIHSTQKVNAGGQSLYFSFYVYKDWVDLGIPSDLYHLPLYATESNGIYYWSGGHPERPDSHYEPGWMQEVYAEINRYNQEAAATGKPIYRAVNMYRWCAWCDGWNINDSPYKGQILTDLDQALAGNYRWPDGGSTPPPPPTLEGENVAHNAIDWLASSQYNTASGGDKAYDGDISAGSKWTSNGSSPESWLALDLGAQHDLTGFIVRHAGAGGEATYFNTAAYRLESGGSLTGPWSILETVGNSAQADSTTTILPSSVETRYIRLVITDAGIDNYARIPELEVYGTPVSSPPPPPPSDPPGDNLALDAVSWSASSVFASNAGGDKAYDSDISPGSKWTSNGQSAESWLTLDLGAAAEITGFIVRHAGAGGEATYFNTEAFRLESGSSLSGPWATLVTVQNQAQENSNTTVLATTVTTRYVRLTITDAGIDNYARIPELEVYGYPGAPPPPAGNLIGNGSFDGGLNGWTVWTERGSMGAEVQGGALHLGSANHNGGVYQQFDTGGVGTEISVSGFWESDPTVPQSQWAEVLIVNGSRLPENGQDLSDTQSDVVLIFKNDTWASPNGWSGAMHLTSPAADAGSFVASETVATIILKSGNMGWTNTGTRFDDIVVEQQGAPPENAEPTAVVSANPTQGEAPLLVSFDGLGSSDPDGDPLTYSWSFGDGETGDGPTVSHTYRVSGTYTASLTVADGRGSSNTASATINVSDSGPPPDGSRWVVLESRNCDGPCDFDRIKAELQAQGKDLGFVKIGFHVSPTGDQRGLGDWMRTLDASGVPFFLKSVDSAGQIYEAAQLKAASGCIDNSLDGGSPTCVPHRLVYRKSVGLGSDTDVPYTGSPDCANPPPADIPYQQIYNETPYEAAVKHWQGHRDAFPPELEAYKHLIWIETINEINRGGSCDFDGDGIGEPFPHNVGLVDPVFGPYTKESEWIAEFAIHSANLAMAEGFNWAAFGWSSGEPEIGSWAGPKMREYLELAGRNPDRVGIATHEYSYTTDGLELAYPSLLGRFQEVFEVADFYGYARPSIVVTEFGWTLNDIPSFDQTMNVDLPWAAKLYAPHHEIQGASIWYLGGGWGGIDKEVQQLIGPMTEYARRNYFVLGPSVP